MSQLDGANGRAPESAGFGGRIRAPRRRLPFVVLGWVVVLGGVVALGLSGRSSQSGAPPAGPNVSRSAPAGAAGTAGPQRLSSFRLIAESIPPRFDPDFPTFPPIIVETSAPGPINLQATRHPSTVFVHGDVFAQQVTWVFVSLLTLDGQVGGWASVSIPGAAGDGRDHRPALRFDVELAVPTGMATGVLIAQASAYNAAGSLIASTRVRLAPGL